MRTTLAISDELLAGARARARALNISLGEVVEAALRRELSTRAEGAERPYVPVFDGGCGPRLGLDTTSNAAMQEALDEGMPLVARR